MMTFHIFTIFPEAFKSYFETSILKRAQEKKLIKIKIYNIRDFAKDKHRTTDDKPYGGGPGMVMKLEPIIRAIKSLVNSKFEIRNSKFILLSPGGKQFTQKMARDWAKKYKNIALICGRYEGIDSRLKKVLQDSSFKIQEISVGPYILNGGELPAMLITEAVSRHIPGVLGKHESLEEEKGSYPVYTRPEIFSARGARLHRLMRSICGQGSAFGGEYKVRKYRVPKVLLSGDHKKITKWRLKHGKII